MQKLYFNGCYLTRRIKLKKPNGERIRSRIARVMNATMASKSAIARVQGLLAIYALMVILPGRLVCAPITSQWSETKRASRIAACGQSKWYQRSKNAGK